MNSVKAGFAPRQKEIQLRQKSGVDVKKDQIALDAEIRAKTEQSLTADELFILDNGISNQGFHYHGSAKFFAQIGKAFADAMIGLRKNP